MAGGGGADVHLDAAGEREHLADQRDLRLARALLICDVTHVGSMSRPYLTASSRGLVRA